MATGAIIGGAVIKGVGAKKESDAISAAGREQEGLDAENREIYQKEVDESIRRTEDINRQTRGTAESQIGASGFGGGSSMDRYMDTIDATHKEDVDWMRESGASNIAIMEREAAARARNTQAQAKSAKIQGIGSAIGGAGGAFKW